MSSLAPGVQVKIQPSGSAPIAGVGTSTAAFLLRVTRRGSLPAVARLVTSHDDFVRVAADLRAMFDAVAAAHVQGKAEDVAAALAAALTSTDTADLAAADTAAALAGAAAAAVHGFFLNGGTRCYVAFYADAAGWTAAWRSIASLQEVALVAAPNASPADQAALASECAALGDRFALLDGPGGVVQTFVRAADADPNKTLLPPNSDFAGYYYPWIKARNPFDGTEIVVPPSGHVAGVYARVDATRGVHKAPANEEIRGALGVAVGLTADQQGDMNELGVNTIRAMQGSVRIWGARTLGGEANDASGTRYINVRRTLVFLRGSIDAGLQWAVFEPNTPALWAKVRRNIGAFLHDVWASGALLGTTAEEAYYVRCDEEINPSTMRDNGQLNVEIGVALVRPAEFITITIGQWSAPGN